MYQQHLPGVVPLLTEKVVNVASVKQRSPFRYPGGKTWLIPRIGQWLNGCPERPKLFIEPFAGGAIVGLTVAFESLADQVILVELDDEVAAVWETIINRGEGSWLAEQIGTFELTAKNVDELLSREDLPLKMQAMQTIVRNRINRGGILAEGAGRLKYGENGKGIRSRWYPTTLGKRIRDIDSFRDRLGFVHGDGLEVMRQYVSQENAVFFIDPPYSASGKKPGSRLYTHWQLDHQGLFRLASELKGDFLMTYDNVEEVQRLADQHGFDSEAIAMKNTHHAKQTELLIGRDLGWVRE